jgi:hypothetical protein
MLVIAVEHGDGLLHNDRSVIEFFVHEMYCAARNFDSVGESLFLSFEAGKCR